VNEIYKAKANKNHTHLEFQPRDIVWIHLRKERFPLRRKSKLTARGDGRNKNVQKVGDNAYKIKLPDEMKISIIFNVGDLTLYIEDEDGGHEDLRKENPSSGGKVDAEQVTQGNLLNHVKAIVLMGHMVIIA